MLYLSLKVILSSSVATMRKEMSFTIRILLLVKVCVNECKLVVTAPVAITCSFFIKTCFLLCLAFISAIMSVKDVFQLNPQVFYFTLDTRSKVTAVFAEIVEFETWYNIWLCLYVCLPRCQATRFQAYYKLCNNYADLTCYIWIT